MTAMGFGISVIEPQGHQTPSHPSVTIIPAVLVAIVNQISQSLGKETSRDQVSGKTDRKLQAPDGSQATQQVNK